MLFSKTAVALSMGLGALAAEDPFKKYTIKAEGIEATFIGYGATLTSLLVNDKDGKQQDVVVGFDDPLDYPKNAETIHNFFGNIVGRYANRIKNGTFTIDGVTSNIPKNEHAGLNTLHGGTVGYDQRNWTVVAANDSSITFSYLDQGDEGFPGTVVNYATNSVQKNRWTTRLVSIPLDQKTPIMLANHIYWNLDAFAQGPGGDIQNDTIHMPYSKRAVVIDSLLIPTGEFETVKGGPLDFTEPKAIGKDINDAHQCGYNCTGYDNAFLLDKPISSGHASADLTVFTLHSPVTGIKMDIKTNQGGIQIYSCGGMNGTIPVKESQQHGGDKKTFVEKFGCLVIETQQVIDAVNHPEWGLEEYTIFSPETEPAVNFATYDFSIQE